MGDGMGRPAASADHLDEPVVWHMRTDFAHLHARQTIAEALEAIRGEPPVGRVIYFYVVDSEHRLRGVVPTRRLLLSPMDTVVESIMVRDPVVLPRTATVLDACELFTMHRLLALPVTDENGRLLGVVDVELYTDELGDLDRREDAEELFQLIGVHLADALQASPLKAFRSRFPWLLANLAGGTIAALLAGLFKAELQEVVALALFIPVVLALAESVSIQSVSLSLQAIRGHRPTLAEVVGKLRQEIVTGLSLGVACGIGVACVALAWLGQLRLVLCLLGGITAGVACASVIGVVIPYTLRRLRREPRVAAGPIALAMTDVVTLLGYFLLARWLLI